ncbi:MAG: hypothetical protein EXS03_09600 [Phycisphaerales bacterium]|nr:hypothetical protein [Phycisphaerales bacterium]
MPSIAPTITPFLWFDGDAEQAVAFYCSIFPASRCVKPRRPEERHETPCGHAGPAVTRGRPGRPRPRRIVQIQPELACDPLQAWHYQGGRIQRRVVN